ncbi:MAG: mechanosensitive ion channel family protein [Gammaproteobacteria bacterium]|nr:mechanosensitive ion channel family protein [Gammaproteobacteria bacterium]
MQYFLSIFIVSFLLISISEAQSVQAEIKDTLIDSIDPEAKPNSTKESKDKINVKALDTNDLEKISDSKKSSLDKKKKDVSQSVVKSQQALDEKEVVQDKVESIEEEQEETNDKITEAKTQHSNTELHQLKKKSVQLAEKHKTLKKDLLEKEKKVQEAFHETAQKQNEIKQLQLQLHNLQIETNNRYSVRKKSLIIVVIILLMFFLLFIKNFIISLFDQGLVVRIQKHHSTRALRMRTFLRILSWIISVIIVGLSIFFILELFGFDSNTTLAGAGIFGVAIGFGAQQFIKDIFSGLFLVIEGQFGIDDFVNIANCSGTVEDINLRFTKLRNYDGNVIFIPNGDIKSVVNYGKGYANSVIIFYIDIDQVIEPVFALVHEVVHELRSAPDLVDEMFSDVQLLGINAFTPSGVEVKFRIKTAPQSQWMVGREVRYSLKERFELEGIRLFQYQQKDQLVKAV